MVCRKFTRLLRSRDVRSPVGSGAGRGRAVVSEQNRGRMLLDFICDEVDHRLNPGGEDCWYCGGEGVTFDCFDGFCLDSDVGCEDCTRDCPECRTHKHNYLKAVREEVIRTNDIDVARE